MQKIWIANTIFACLVISSAVVSLVLGSSLAWIGGLVVAAGLHVATLQARNQWGAIFAASQIRSGDKRAGSSDGTGTGEAGA